MAEPAARDYALFALHAFQQGDWNKACQALGALEAASPGSTAQLTLLQSMASGYGAQLQEIQQTLKQLHWLAVQQDWHQQMQSPRYRDPRHLVPYGYKVYSQTDEDGILAEIFRRIGTTNQRFIEFGVQVGLECNTMNLLLQGWSGLWLDGGAANMDAIANTHASLIASGHLKASQAFITAENVNSLFQSHGFTGELDLLSIDIDRNDYWVWQAISVVNPRVVVIEVNAAWRPPLSITVPYDPHAIWNGKDSYGGASLKALEKLGAQKGYALVGCGYGGGNAFFVQRDWVSEEKFLPPFTAEQHYEPPRFFFWPCAGHPPGVGPVVEV